MRLMKPFVAAFVLAAALCANAADIAWPTKPVRIIVPGGAGSVVDLRARWLADRLTASLGQPFIVENKPGAGGNLGTELGARSPANGYTLTMIHQGTMAVNPHLYANPGYDSLRDFVPLTRIGFGPLMLAVNPSLPVHSVKDLVDLARTRRLNYGTPGVGTPPHVAVELFLRATGIEATHIPYKGGGQAVADLIGGTTDFEIEGLTVLMPQAKAGRIRAIALTGVARDGAFPELPTMREEGVRDYEYTGWVGIALPAATPAAIVARVHEAIANEMRSPAAAEWFATFGADPTPDTPQQFAAIIRAEYERMGHLIRTAGIKAE